MRHRPISWRATTSLRPSPARSVPRASVTLADARGAPLRLDVQLSSFPSTAGPIGKAELRPAADAPEPVVADQPAPPAAAPLAPPIASQPAVSSPTADELRIILTPPPTAS